MRKEALVELRKLNQQAAANMADGDKANTLLKASTH